MPNSSPGEAASAEIARSMLDSGQEGIRTVAPTTVFTDAVAGQETDHTSVNKDLGKQLSVRNAEGMTDFLERARTVATVRWTESSSGVLGTWVFPQVLMTEQSFVCKSGYFKYLRAGIRVYFNFNASAGHYGKLIARWIPAVTLEQTGIKREASSFQADPWMSLTALDGAQGVDIDASSSSLNTMVIPYELANQFMDLEKMFEEKTDPYDYTMGALRIAVMTPLTLVSAAAARIDVRITASFTNVTIDMPLYRELPFKDKAAVWKSRGGLFPAVNQLVMVNKPAEDPDLWHEDQIGESEQKSSKGVVSGALDTVSTATSFVKNIPIIGDVAEAISPFMSIASSLASSIGLGKPNDVQPDTAVTQRAPSLANTNGLLTGKTLTAKNDASLPILTTGMSTSTSEMSMRYICGRYSFLNCYRVAGDVPVGTRIFNLSINPGSLGPVVNNLTLDGLGFVPRVFTYQSMVCNTVGMVRGGVRIKVEVLMSAFQTVKLALSYFPPGTTPPETITYEMQSNILSEIFSANGTTVKELIVPYAGDTFARPTTNPDPEDRVSDSFGVFTLDVYNEIAATNNSQNPAAPIYVNVWYAMNHDTEFFAYVQPDPLSTTKLELPLVTYQMVRTDTGKAPPVIKTYREGAKTNIKESDTSVPARTGNTETDLVKYVVNMLGPNLTGEEIVSIKDQIQRFTLLRYTDKTTTFVIDPASRVMSNSKFPFSIFPGQNLSSVPLFYWYSFMYRFRRGGLNLYFPKLHYTTENSAITAGIDPTYSSADRPAVFGTSAYVPVEEILSVLSNNGVQFWGGDPQQQGIVKAPYMSNAPYTYNNNFIPVSGQKLKYQSVQNPTLASIATQAPYMLVGISAADDFSFGKLFTPPTFYEQLS